MADEGRGPEGTAAPGQPAQPVSDDAWIEQLRETESGTSSPEPTPVAVGAEPSGITISGRVRSGSGQPRHQAAVTVLSPGGTEVARGQTAPDGSFSIRGLPRGRYTVLAIDLPYSPAAVTRPMDAPSEVVDLRLRGTGAIRGRLVGEPDLAPISGVEVTLAPVEGQTDPTATLHKTTTDWDGGYRFEQIEEGAWTLSAQQPGHRLAAIGVDVRTGEQTEKDLHLTALGRIEGLVTVNGDHPFAAVPLVLLGADGSVIATTTTDRDGRYWFEDLAQASYVVLSPSLDPQLHLVSVRSGQSTDCPIRIGPSTRQP